MNAEYVFLEYGCDTVAVPQIQSQLSELGFSCRSQHSNQDITIWTQNLLIILLRVNDTFVKPGVSGIGFIVDQVDENRENLLYDHDYDLFYVVDPNGINNYLISKRLSSLDHFVSVDQTAKRNPELDYVSGLVYNCDNEETHAHYAELLPKEISGSHYKTLSSKNNRFRMLFDLQKTTGDIHAVICESKDIFHSIAYFTLRDMNTMEYTIDKDKISFNQAIYNKVVGYNCAFFGNQKSHSIEKRIIEPVANLDFIVRMRERFLDIPEESVREHYGNN